MIFNHKQKLSKIYWFLCVSRRKKIVRRNKGFVALTEQSSGGDSGEEQEKDREMANTKKELNN